VHADHAGAGPVGQVREDRHPGGIVTKFLAEHGVVVEKTGLYSFFIMFTIGITKGRWNTLLTALQQFKDDYDRNAPMWRILPEFCAGPPALRAHGPARPVPGHPRDVRQERHRAADDRDVPVGPAAGDEAQRGLRAHRAPQDRAGAIDELEGRITTSLLTPYPPGIPLLIPGERFNRKIVDYLKFARVFNEAFPGFDTDVHGLVEVESGAMRRYYVDCVRV
jgi:arginine decarboxylase